MNKVIVYGIIFFATFGVVVSAEARAGSTKNFFMGNKYLAKNGYENQPGILGMEFIYEKTDFPQCHASTIVETKDGLAAAWFGGTREGAENVCIWLSRLTSKGWIKPVKVADGVENPTLRYPCWNPVLFQPADGPLMLFYKVGLSFKKWRGVMKTSKNCGKTWSKAIPLPEGFAGPIKDKPIELDSNVLLCPSSTEDNGWRVHFERCFYETSVWKKTEPINDGIKFAAIQPTILTADNKLLALCRTKQGVIAQIWSCDKGETWSRMEATELPNPNSGIDAVTLKNGMHLLVYNHTIRKDEGKPHAREMLNVAISKDGINWNAALVLEYSSGAEFSYPAVIQTTDGLVHITYTWKRQRIKHVVLDVNKLKTTMIKDGKWPIDF